MLAGDFYSKLKQLNSSIWADTKHTVCHYHKDFNWCGLYIYDTYIMGVPQQYIPEYSILGIDGIDLVKRGLVTSEFTGSSGLYYDYDKIIAIHSKLPQMSSRILAKGYRAILATLCKAGYIDKDKAQKVFGITIEPTRTKFPARYIDLGF